MKRIIVFIVLVISIISCKQETKSPEEVKKQIADYEYQIKELENKISLLKKEITDSVSHDNSILVGVMQAQNTAFDKYVEVTGNVQSNLQALVSPEINGQIDKIIVQEGDYVKKGQVLLVLKSEITDKTIEEVKTSLELAKTVYEKQKELWDQKIGSEIQYLQAKNQKESLEKRLESLQTQKDMARIKAPFDGFVETIFQKEGEIAAPGRQVLLLVNLSDLKVVADVSEAYLPVLKEGNKVEINFPAYPDLTLHSTITVVGSVINPNNRTVKIQIKIPNKDMLLKPNIIANVKLKVKSLESAIIVPSIIIKNDADLRSYLYVATEKNGRYYAEKRYVKTGDSYGNNTVITEGLLPGDRIIYQGYNLVKNGTKVRIK